MLEPGQVKGRFLIHVVVDPVGKQQVRVSAPAHVWGLARVVPGEVIHGDRDRYPGSHVAVVFQLERQWIVLRMAGDEDLAAVTSRERVDPGLGRFDQDFELWHLLDVDAADFGMPRRST